MTTAVTAVLLVFLGAFSRLLPHPPNLVAMGAIGLYAGARLPRRWAWVIPIAAMALSDLVLDWGTGRSAITAHSGRCVRLVRAHGLRRPSAGAERAAGAARGSLRRRSRPFLPHDELRGLGVARNVPADARGPRALLRRGDPVLLEHAHCGAARERVFFFQSTRSRGGARGVERPQPGRGSSSPESSPVSPRRPRRFRRSRKTWW